MASTASGTTARFALAPDVSGHMLHAGAGAMLVTSEDTVVEVGEDGSTRRLSLEDVESSLGPRPLYGTLALESDRYRLTGSYPAVPNVVFEPVRHGLSQIVGDSFADAHFLMRRTDVVSRPEASEGESVVGRIVEGQIISVATSPYWIWSIGRSPSGRLYAGAFCDSPGGVWRTPTDGSLVWEHLSSPASQGLFVLHDEFVMSWCGKEFHLFDGRAFRSMPAPPGEVLDVHGIREDWVVAVGHGGLIARWDGSRWHRWEPPMESVLSRVHVVSEDEMYVTGPTGALFEGSRHGWVERAPLEGMGNGVVKWRGDVYVADPALGLLRLERDVLVPIDLAVHPANLYPGRDALLMIEGTTFSEPPDLATLRHVDERDLEIALRDLQPSWR